MAEISLDNTRFRSAYVALWELLSTGISQEPWFWYGEAVLYGNGGAEEWRPLLLRRIRQLKGAVEMPDSDFASPFKFAMPAFYKGFYDATDDEDVLSVLRAVHAQFGRQQGDHAPLPVFAALNCNDTNATSELENRLIDRAKRMTALAAGRYHVLLSSETVKAMNAESAKREEPRPKWVSQYSNYVTKVMNVPFYEAGTIKGALYPENAWLFALPIYDIQRGRPLLLATFIIIVEGKDFTSDDDTAEKDRLKRFEDIERYLVQLEVQTTHILSHRFFSVIDGFVPGSDPIVLLAHPSLSKTANITELRMEGDTHESAGFDKAFRVEDSALKRAFQRSYIDPKKLCLERAMVPNNKTLFGHNELPVAPRHWLKPLYAHRRERAHLPYEPSVNGTYTYDDGSFKALGWLIALLRPTVVSSEGAFTNRVFLYPLDSEDASHNRFQWPVEPGVRFLIPWLNAVRSIADAVKSNGITVMLISGSGKRWANDNLAQQPCPELGQRSELSSPVIEKWIELRATDKVRPNGVVVAFDCRVSDQDEVGLERLIQGWTRALLNPFGRRGNDTAPIQNMLLGDIGAVLTGKGLSFPAGDPLFLPLAGSLPIDVDLKALSKELLFAVTWRTNV